MASEELMGVLLSPWVLGLLGLCIGSFLNVVIYRMPVMMQRQWLADCADQLEQTDELRRHTGLDGGSAQALASAGRSLQQGLQRQPALSLARPRSRCPHCGHQLRWHENLPLLGWLRLGGRCAACKAPISARYPLVELFTGLLFAAIAWRFGAMPISLLYCGLGAALVALAGIDWDTTLLPDDINQPLLWAGLLAALLGWTLPLNEALIGATAGYLSLWSVYWVFKLATGKEGMGYGDFKLLAAIGAWLGWQILPLTILLSSLMGAVVGIALILLRKHGREIPIPFGPYLAAAGLLALYWGKPLTEAYLGLL